MKKIDFLIVGAQKGGTTTLLEHLKKHPNIETSIRKEVHFFDRDNLFKKNTSTAQLRAIQRLYEKSFPKDKDGIIRGEATPTYMYNQHCAQRIYKYNPNMKLIFLLRNPILRAYSAWNMAKIRMEKKNCHIKSFKQCIEDELKYKSNNAKTPYLDNSFIDRGFYTTQIERFTNRFPKAQMLFIKSEDLKLKHEILINEVYEFLKVEHKNKDKLINKHERKYSEEISYSNWTYLRNIYFKEIKKLEIQLGWDCSSWLNQTEKMVVESL